MLTHGSAYLRNLAGINSLVSKPRNFVFQSVAVTALLFFLSVMQIGDALAVSEGSVAAEAIFASAPPRLLQFRTLVADADRQISIGSGFLVASDGLAITNYHVVSQVALEPKTYRLEYAAADGSHGDATILAVDLANDLAVVHLDKREAPFFVFDEAAIAQGLPKGERLFSMGNPLDLGFAINEGTYNGPIAYSFSERIHFAGALNPGMSGGPTVNARGEVVGINVSKRRGGELVSFLVPARFAKALLERARSQTDPPVVRTEVVRQLTAWQSNLYKSFEKDGFRSAGFGPYRVPQPASSWFNCWAQTNAGSAPKPRASINSTNCSSDTGMFVAEDLNTGSIQVNQSYVKTIDLNRFQFANSLSALSQPRLISGGPFRKWYLPEKCRQDFISNGDNAEGQTFRVIWCAQPYREFDGLYDISMISVTQDHDTEALVSRLTLQAVAYDDAMAIAQKFLESIRANK